MLNTNEMKKIIKLMSLLVILGLAGCSEGVEELRTDELVQPGNPDSDDDDCKGDCDDVG